MKVFLMTGLRAGLRRRNFQAVFVLGILLVVVAFLSGSFSPRQPQTVALDVGLSGVRFTLVLLVLSWIQELMSREIERKTVLFSLAYPISRSAFILGRYFAVIILAMLAILLLGLALWFAVLIVGKGYQQGHPIMMGQAYSFVLLGLWLDVAVVTAVAAAIACLSTSSVMVVATGAAFAIAGKALGPTFDYLLSSNVRAEFSAVYAPLLNAVRWVVPDLSRLDWRVWSLYGMQPDGTEMVWSVVMSLAYIVCVLSIAVWMFSRRDLA